MQTEGSACGHPTDPFPRPGACNSHRTEGITESEGREGANGVGGGTGVGGGNRDWNRVGGGNGDGDGVGTGTGARTGREQEHGRGWRPVNEHRMEMGTGAGTETREVAEMRTGTKMGTGTGTRIGLWRLEER